MTDIIKGFLWGLALCSLVTLLAGCKTKYVAVPEVHYRDSVYVKYARDSVFLRDSVWSTMYVRGDTVYSEKYKTRYVYKNVLRIDTVLRTVRDSVPTYALQVRERTVYAMRWYESLFMYFGIACAAVLVSVAVVWLIRRKRS